MIDCKCSNCKFLMYEQFDGYPINFYCFHPYRSELDNSGRWTFPKNHEPSILIGSGYHVTDVNHMKVPKWCYILAVERAKLEEPSFDPDVQRKILYDFDD